jgi:hypothetical protein
MPRACEGGCDMSVTHTKAAISETAAFVLAK